MSLSQFVEYTEPQWRELNMRALHVDQAYMYVSSNYLAPSYLYTLSDECYSCPYTRVKALPAVEDQSLSSTNEPLTLSTAFALNFKIYADDQGHYAYDNVSSLCTLRTKLQEFGVYNLTLQLNGSCNFDVDKEGVPIYYSFLGVWLLVAALLIVLRLGWCAWRCARYDEAAAVADSIGEAASKATQRKRMRSLDTFRGLAIVLMIFVNSGGGGYWWIEHATWNGLHVADLVFPSFLWIMGVCVPLSVHSQLGRGVSKARLCLRITWRACKLFAIGLCLNSINGPQLEQLRIMGVLQRFGVAFLISGILHTLCSRRQHIVPQRAWHRAIYDVCLFSGELAVLLALIATYLGLTFGLPVPGCPLGYLGPGGKHDLAAYPNCIGGAAGYIDRQVLGNAHIYQHPTAKHVYDSSAFDPEGVFGCILSVVQVLFGVFAGVTLLIHPTWQARIKRWLICAALLGIIGGALCGFSKEHGIIPVNKNLWSISFVFITVAVAYTLLSFLYYVIDVRQWWSGHPFTESGMNAIIMYVGHTIMHKMLPWHWRIGAMNTHFVLLLESVWNTLIWIAIALYLDSQEFYYSL
ncbi:heparan-alpha-glucosaminide N-acetyltransferase [Scaptodrosophila lebanonensis]|uniref:Heparan-alpha-glucosaminide N-acetyltransferase n=1 Tax=Drosophila lebanonensis TaxID=7225 RepID=A0A6J2TVQ5_DROLE|nr:heparan-alpha-glucosaminide N-acetyltransferase [Scaptodrosophila lebanonensis]